MAGQTIPYFQNDAGYDTIEIGVTEFMCCGANPPHDHPHVFIDMGNETEIVCGYCSTLYRLNRDLHGTETRPAGCAFVEEMA